MTKMIKLLQQAKELKAGYEKLSIKHAPLNLDVSNEPDERYLEEEDDEDVLSVKWYERSGLKWVFLVSAILFFSFSFYLNGKAGLALAKMDKIQTQQDSKNIKIEKELLGLRNELASLRTNELEDLKSLQLTQKSTNNNILTLSDEINKFTEENKQVRIKSKDLELTNKLLLDKYIALNQAVKELQYQLKEVRRGL